VIWLCDMGRFVSDRETRLSGDFPKMQLEVFEWVDRDLA